MVAMAAQAELVSSASAFEPYTPDSVRSQWTVGTNLLAYDVARRWCNAVVIKESGFDDADAFFAALKAHDFGSFRRFGVDGAAVLACDAGASAAYNTAGESFHWFKGE